MRSKLNALVGSEDMFEDMFQIVCQICRVVISDVVDVELHIIPLLARGKYKQTQRENETLYIFKTIDYILSKFWFYTSEDSYT